MCQARTDTDHSSDKGSLVSRSVTLQCINSDTVVPFTYLNHRPHQYLFRLMSRRRSLCWINLSTPVTLSVELQWRIRTSTKWVTYYVKCMYLHQTDFFFLLFGLCLWIKFSKVWPIMLWICMCPMMKLVILKSAPTVTTPTIPKKLGMRCKMQIKTDYHDLRIS